MSLLLNEGIGEESVWTPGVELESIILSYEASVGPHLPRGVTAVISFFFF